MADPNLLICNICTFTRPSKYVVIKHLKSHLMDQRYDDYHDRIYQQISALQEAKFKNYICNKCDSAFSSKFNLNAHQKKSCLALNTTHIDKAIKKICDIVVDPEDLKRSIRTLSDRLAELEPETITQNSELRLKIKLKNEDEVLLDERIENSTLLAVGQETFDMLEDPHISIPLIEKAANPTNCKMLKDTLVDIFQLVHCHEDYPENWNIYIGYHKKYFPIQAYDGEAWQEYDPKYLLHDVCCRQCLSLLRNIATQLLKNKLIDKDLYDRFRDSLLFLKDKNRRQTFFRFTGNEFFTRAHNAKKLIKKVYLKTRNQQTTNDDEEELDDTL